MPESGRENEAAQIRIGFLGCLLAIQHNESGQGEVGIERQFKQSAVL